MGKRKHVETQNQLDDVVGQTIFLRFNVATPYSAPAFPHTRMFQKGTTFYFCTRQKMMLTLFVK
jgi:hypothetical protein